METFMKKVFESNYEEFKDYCLEEEKPIAMNLQIDDPENWTLKEFRDFAVKFREETGLVMNYISYVCDKCNALHVIFEINDAEDVIEE